MNEQSKMSKLGLVVYEGPSILTGDPIVAILTAKTTNEKTGDMPQLWIIRSDVEPHRTSVLEERAICGDCPHKQGAGGGCYVTKFQAPLSVYRTYHRRRYTAACEVSIQKTVKGRRLRLGAYGDPAALPEDVLRDLVAAAGGKTTGYTHQWETRPELADLLMASVDSPEQAEQAVIEGWRYFRVRPVSETSAPLVGEIACPAEAGDTQCAQCGLCSGAGSFKSIYIDAHGARAKKVTA